MGRLLSDRCRSVTPEMVVDIYGRYGQEMSLEKASYILELMYELSGQSLALEIRLATEQQKKGKDKPKRRPTIHKNENS